MKKKSHMHIVIFLIVLTILLIIPIRMFIKPFTDNVSFNGNLCVKGTQIRNQYGMPIQLKGVSTHGIQWDKSNLINHENLKKLKDEWNINTLRIAMYTEEEGYLMNPYGMRDKAIEITDMCINLDLYVIIDWHILLDNNPMTYKKEAIEFFDFYSKKYRDVPNIIYEICNEPNGYNVSWNYDIVPYANEVIPVIRNNSPKSLIIVGTPDYSKDILSVINNELNYENILYSFHFYAGTHGEIYRENIDTALEKKIPIFVSEWGTSTAIDGTEVFLDDSKKWIDFLNEKNISWINWSFSNVDECTSILKKEKNEIVDENLTESGIFIKNILTDNN